MTWNPDAPGEMLDRASRVFWELCGPAPYLNWLEKEVSRTKVHLEYKKAVVFSTSPSTRAWIETSEGVDRNEYKKAVVFSASTAGGAREPQQPMPPMAATGAASIDSQLLNEMVDVLRWYNDPKNYRSAPGGGIPVLADDGSRAAHVLNKCDIGQMGT